MDIIVSGHEYFYDITSMSMLFFPGEKTSFVDKSRADVYIRSSVRRFDDRQLCVTSIKYHGNTYRSQKTAPPFADTKDLVKFTFFKACSKATGIVSPWGTLTGIRPISVYQRLKNQGYNASLELKRRFLLSDKKIAMLEKIAEFQDAVLDKGPRDVSIYISIPFCPSKCTYCSFISVAAVNKAKLMKEYISLLCDEIRDKAELTKKYALNVRSLYIGGGTPGILSAEELGILLNTAAECFDLCNIPEKCFELGRPDTVSREKLALLSHFGFDRICINTQTTNDEILRAVNRKHTSGDYSTAVAFAGGFDFNSINTDLIAGLPGESVDSFKKSLSDVIKAGVDNITVHTLAIKRSATLAESDKYYNPDDRNVDAMVEYAYDTLARNGYVPYYIYRQKNCVSNGENIGFCKRETPCLYNVYMMEDVHSVIACGAGASTKIVNGTNVQRVINVKYPMDYVADFEKVRANTYKTEQLLRAVYTNE